MGLSVAETDAEPDAEPEEDVCRRTCAVTR
jgi:hypothetical protein